MELKPTLSTNKEGLRVSRNILSPIKTFYRNIKKGKKVIFTSVSSPLGNILRSCSKLQAKRAVLYLK